MLNNEEWIKTSDRLPTEGEWCWIYGTFLEDGHDKKFVLQGRFQKDCPDSQNDNMWKDDGFNPGWCIDEDNYEFVLRNEISHWMPYFMPAPPKD